MQNLFSLLVNLGLPVVETVKTLLDVGGGTALNVYWRKYTISDSGRGGRTDTYLRETLRTIAKQSPQVDLILFTNRENDGLFRKTLVGYPHIEFQRLNFFERNRYIRILRKQIELPFRAKPQLSRLDLLWFPGYMALFLFSVVVDFIEKVKNVSLKLL